MKRLMILLLLILLSNSIVAQSFHFAYVRIDGTVDREYVAKILSEFYKKYNSEQFVLFYSNSHKVFDNRNWNEEALWEMIVTQNASDDISVPDELSQLCDLLERYIQFGDSADAAGFPITISEAGFKAVKFHYFVGDDFLTYDYNNLLLARMQFVEQLNGKYDDYLTVYTFYHPCNEELEKCQVKPFNQKYGIKLTRNYFEPNFY